MLKRAASAIAALALAATACTAGGSPPRPQPTPDTSTEAASLADWTLLVYMAADNNLDGAALKNLQAMAAAPGSDRVNVVVQIDRRVDVALDQPVLNLPGFDSAKRLAVRGNSLVDLATLGPIDMTAGTTLADFVSWGIQRFPARRYGLILWDHGAGWRGYGADSGAARSGPMPIPELAAALAGVGRRIDLIGFDACLMASIEVALQLQLQAQVLVGSEELEPGLGWDYQSALAALASQPDMDALQLGHVLADSYIANLRAQAPRRARYATLSVVNLSFAPQVQQALQTFTEQVDAYAARIDGAQGAVRLAQLMADARRSTTAFGRDSLTDPGLAYDIRSLVRSAGLSSHDPAVASAALDMQAALDKLVVYQASGDGYRDQPPGGLSVGLPVLPNLADERQQYAALPAMATTGWQGLVRDLFAAATSDAIPPSIVSWSARTSQVTPGGPALGLAGLVTDDTGVDSAVVTLVAPAADHGLPARLISFDERPVLADAGGQVDFDLDGQAWFATASDAENATPVTTTSWRSGERAVFGQYLQTPSSRPLDAYLVFDESGGELVEGFETHGGALAALSPGVDSQFAAVVYTPELQTLSQPWSRLNALHLVKRDLDPGEYLVTLTAFDIADHATTAAQSVWVQPRADLEPVVSAGGASACQPLLDESMGRPGDHAQRVHLEPGQTFQLPLRLDALETPTLRYVVDGSPSRDVRYRLLRPDHLEPSFETASGISAQTVQLEHSGQYTLELAAGDGGDAAPVDVTAVWTVGGVRRTGPPLLDLDAFPEQVDQLEQQGAHRARLSVPAGQSISISLDYAGGINWIDYAFDTADPTDMSAVFGVLSGDGKLRDVSPLCGHHGGGIELPGSDGSLEFVIDNRQAQTPLSVVVTLDVSAVGAP